ncbi:hypothetical protein DFJ73DRAFT_137277 [Zopfochytrium polystomum]|nr:hypothetical protein DFJ73DRAFT_137277 [Zopfochytrium polystomum]
MATNGAAAADDYPAAAAAAASTAAGAGGATPPPSAVSVYPYGSGPNTPAQSMSAAGSASPSQQLMSPSSAYPSPPNPSHHSTIVYSDYESIRQYLASYLITLASEDTVQQQQQQSQQPQSLSFAARVARSSPQRASAQEKMARLPNQPFMDLATNVIDEMNRRIMDNPDIPYLPVRADLDPKKNQARQKLGTLPTPRFKDLACDVLFEIERRFPEHLITFEAKFSGLNGAITGSGVDQYSNGVSGASSEAFSQLREEYEKIMRDLRDNISRLERSNKEKDNELQSLRSSESSLRQQVSELQNQLSRSVGAHEVLKQEHLILEEEYKGQLMFSNEMKAEATRLAEEVRNLSKRNEELVADKAKLQAAAEAAAAAAASAARNLMASGGVPGSGASTVGVSDPSLPTVIDNTRIAAYLTAISNLLVSTRSGSPTEILVAMKAVVLACKRITEDTEAYERNASAGIAPPISVSDREALNSIKSRLSDCLQQLMLAAKTHATSAMQQQQQPHLAANGAALAAAGARDVERLAEALNGVVMELAGLLNAKASQGTGAPYPPNGLPNKGEAPPTVTSPFNSAQGVEDLGSLKAYLEQQTDQIVSAIQTLLLAMKSPTFEPESVSQMIRNVTTVVQTVLRVASHTLARTSAGSPQSGAANRENAQRAVRDLAVANGDLEKLGVEVAAGGLVVPAMRQKLASSSFEIAKYVKELIRVVE